MLLIKLANTWWSTNDRYTVAFVYTLSNDTIHAVKAFVELVKYLFTIPGVKAFLSEKISQDPIEKFFGCQRQRGRVNENPNVQEFLKNTQAL